jgi:hypothetical protein
VKNSHSRNARMLVVVLGLILVPGLFADPGGVPHCPPTSNDPACKASVAEPSATPEMVLYLAVTGSSFLLLWRRNRRAV